MWVGAAHDCRHPRRCRPLNLSTSKGLNLSQAKQHRSPQCVVQLEESIDDDGRHDDIDGDNLGDEVKRSV